MKRNQSYLAVDVNHGSGYSELSSISGIIFVAIMLIFTAAWLISLQLADQNNCLGPPYLYITTHDNTNIMKYSRDGCSMAERVLWYGTKSVRELRGMAVGQYNNQDALFVCDAAESEHGTMSQVNITSY